MSLVPFFHGSHPLSNWFDQPMVDPMTGHTFATVEHWMMWHKANLFTRKDLMAPTLFSARVIEANRQIMIDILANPNPAAAKAKGKEVQGFNEEVWVKNREDIVKKGLYLKLSHSRRTLLLLLAVDHENDILVEASKWDRIWGCGFDAADPRIANQDLWGLNLLGKLWQEILVEIKTTPLEHLRLPKHVKGWIEEYNSTHH